MDDVDFLIGLWKKYVKGSIIPELIINQPSVLSHIH